MALLVNLSAYAANGGAPLTYSSGTTYAVGDVVVSGGVQFKCKATTAGNAPATGANTWWVEIVERTIGDGTRNYQTIAAWIAACPDLITNNQIWKGLIYKEGAGATEWAASIGVSSKNTTTSADNFLWLEPASGQGFIDNASVRTNALVYNNANGVAISSGTSGVYGGDRCGFSFLRGLQLKGRFEISNVATYLNVSQCIVDWGSTSASFAGPEWGTIRAVNCAFRSAQTSGTFIQNNIAGQQYINCTFLGAGGTTAVFIGAASGFILKNCVFLNFASIAATGVILSTSSNNNATNLASFGYIGASNLTGLTAANQIENTASPFDMRVKAGASLINAAVRIQAETDDFDISRFSRSLTTPTIGAWEYPAVTYAYVRPASDVTTQWTPSSGTLHYALINETTPNDTQYIYSTAAGQTDEVGLQAMSTPVAGTNLLVNYRVIGVTGTGTSVTTSLYSGATLVKADTARTVDGTYSMVVTSGDYSGVSDWSNMRIRFVSS
jgi:hypothetical protein